MALRLSTGFALALAGKGQNVLAFGTDFTFTNSTGIITSASYQFAGVQIGDTIYVKGSNNNANKAGKVTAVESDGSAITVDATLVDESAGTATAISCYSYGMSFSEILRYGVIAVYTGTQPSTADDAETGTLLGYFTKTGATFTPGETTQGILLADAVDSSLNGVDGALIGLDSTMTSVTCTPIASGTAGWVRYYANDRVLGASTTAKRLDMVCGVGTGEFRLSSQTFTAGVSIALNSISFLQRQAA
jgi:hypothetical protein